MKKQFLARYILLDGSPRELWPIYAESADDALREAHEYTLHTVSKTYDIRNIKIAQT